MYLLLLKMAAQESVGPALATRRILADELRAQQLGLARKERKGTGKGARELCTVLERLARLAELTDEAAHSFGMHAVACQRVHDAVVGAQNNEHRACLLLIEGERQLLSFLTMQAAQEQKIKSAPINDSALELAPDTDTENKPESVAPLAPLARLYSSVVSTHEPNLLKRQQTFYTRAMAARK